jgi:hypothetical protein
MASEKWLEPTLGWVAAKADPVNNNKVNDTARLAEAVLAYRFLNYGQKSTFTTPKQFTDWYASIQKNPPPAYKAYLGRIAGQVKTNQLTKKQQDLLTQYQTGKITRAQYNTQAAAVRTELANIVKNPKAYDNVPVAQLVAQGLTPWQNTTFKSNSGVSGGFGNPQAMAAIASGDPGTFDFGGVKPIANVTANYTKAGGNIDKVMATSTMGGWNQLASLGSQPTLGFGGSQMLQQIAALTPNKKLNDVYAGQTLAPGVTRTVAELVADRVQTERKGSVNDYYTLNNDVLSTLGINNAYSGGKEPVQTRSGFANILNTAFYDPSAYDDPTLMRYFDAPSANIRGAGSFTYSDEARQWGGMDYADEAAIAIFKKYGMTPEQLTAKYGQYQGMTNSELNPLLYNVQMADGKTAYYVPYDFAIHGVTGTNGSKTTNFMPAKSLDWWLGNATPVSLGSSFKMPDANKNNPYGLRTSTPNIGFITTMNPLEDNPADRTAFMRDLNLGNTDGESNQFTNGLYAGTSRIRQSYDDGPGFLQKAIGAIASFGLPFVPGFQALGPVFSNILSNAIGGTIAGGDPGDIARSAAFGGIGAAAGQYVAKNYFGAPTNAAGIADIGKMSGFGKFASYAADGLTQVGLDAATARTPSMATQSSFAPTTSNNGATEPSGTNSGAAPTAQGGAPSPTNPTMGTDSSVSAAGAAPVAAQSTFKSSVASNLNDVQPTPNAVMDPSIYARDRRWGGKWGQTISF